MARVGDIVLYTLGSDARTPGELRPAIVVVVWSESFVGLNVFLDRDNDYDETPSRYGEVGYEADGGYDTWCFRPGDA